MVSSKRLTAVSAFSLCGMGYSSYLTYYTVTSHSSACELYYFGMPSCFYGLLLYLLIFLPSLSLWIGDRRNRAWISLLGISTVGVAFSGTLTGYVMSLHSCLATSLTIFGIPPCVLGLAMFTAVFGIAMGMLLAKPRARVPLIAR